MIDEFRPILTQPSGLVGFLQLKNSGRNPSTFPDSVQSVLELREWLWETNSETSIVSGAALIPLATVAGNLQFLQVPSTEVWALLDLNASFVTGVGQTLTYRFIFLDNPVPQGNAHGLSDYFSILASNLQHQMMPRSFRIPLLRPGHSLGINITAIATAAADIGGTFRARIVRMRV